MPIYEFSCRKCGHGFEEILTHSDLEGLSLECPNCRSAEVERGLSSFATAGGSESGCPSASSCGNAGFT